MIVKRFTLQGDSRLVSMQENIETN